MTLSWHSARAEAQEGALSCPVSASPKTSPSVWPGRGLPRGGGLSCRRAAVACRRCSPGHECWAMCFRLCRWVVPPSLSQRGRRCSSGCGLYPRLRPGALRSRASCSTGCSRPVSTPGSVVSPRAIGPHESPRRHRRGRGRYLQYIGPQSFASYVLKNYGRPQRVTGSAGYKGPSFPC